MAERSTSIPEPLILDRRFLNLFPSADGVQHDERKAGRMPWKPLVRKIPADARLHGKVLERFRHQGPIHFDEAKAYRPESLREHQDVREFYAAPKSDGGL